MLRIALAVVSLLLAASALAQLPGETPPPDDTDALGLGHLEAAPPVEVLPGSPEVSVRVLGVTPEWTGSGAMLKKGVRYRIAASGQWRMGAMCNITGASGVGSHTLLCFLSPLARPVVSGFEAGALVAKVGKEGKPFFVGEEHEFTSPADGVLYFRANDRDWPQDNTGFLTLRIAAAQAAPPAATPPPPPAAAKRQQEQPPPAAAPTAVPSQRWAVVIGVSEYSDSRIPSLRYAAADARAFHDWLVSPEGGRYPPAQVKLLLDREATASAMKDALFTWLRRAIAEDVVVIYFAGHGSPDSPDTPQNLYLLPHDTRYDAIASTGFPMWDIETALKRFIKAKRVIVLADACHAGGVGASFDMARRAMGEALNVNRISSGLQGLSAVGEGIAVLSAADDRQLSAEGPIFGGGHGAFTHFLLEGLKGQADYNNDRQVTLGELIPYVSEHVRRETLNQQSPTVAGRFDPAIAIGR